MFNVPYPIDWKKFFSHYYDSAAIVYWFIKSIQYNNKKHSEEAGDYLN